MTKTNLEIINFINFARSYMKQHEKPTKFRYALERMEKRAAKLHENYADDLAALNIEHAATDEHQTILTDAQGNFRFTKDGIRARNKAAKELLEKAVAIEPYMATEGAPEDLNEAEKKVCAGFVIPEIPEAGDQLEAREYNAEPLVA